MAPVSINRASMKSQLSQFCTLLLDTKCYGCILSMYQRGTTVLGKSMHAAKVPLSAIGIGTCKTVRPCKHCQGGSLTLWMNCAVQCGARKRDFLVPTPTCHCRRMGRMVDTEGLQGLAGVNVRKCYTNAIALHTALCLKYSVSYLK